MNLLVRVVLTGLMGGTLFTLFENFVSVDGILEHIGMIVIVVFSAIIFASKGESNSKKE
ncbi:hypothetical protein [Alkalihalobacillus sp. AL-G]|uniref:hypothetical protein n=1 Tax=Alkalihalobacillus sp. AL-G TaxID=2926399 RepID=UPI002729BB6B|nr:hypothetical protein [Alkalihalobacillus sp. AL-G]WLD94424.1 hypothetical protein MOJ78_05920 [Alkalihalobacillus sp. AL-G]